MRRSELVEVGGPIPSQLLDVLSLTDCLHRLGCSERDTNSLVEQWLAGKQGPVVGQVSGPVRSVAPRMAAAA